MAAQFQERGIYAASTSLEILTVKRAEAHAPFAIGHNRAADVLVRFRVRGYFGRDILLP
jgi:hypothetical protein